MKKQTRDEFIRKANKQIVSGMTVHSSASAPVNLIKQANAALTSGFDSNSGMARAPLMYMDPLFDPVLLMFPKENLKELFRRLRHYRDYNPAVRNLIHLHSTFPYSDAEVRCASKALQPYYRDYAERLDLLQLITQAAGDLELLGESIHYGTWDIDRLEWREFTQLPPENVNVVSSYIPSSPIYTLKPDEDLRKLLTSGKDENRAIIEQFDPEMREAIESGVPWRMANDRVIHITNNPEGYILRGISPLKAALRYLLLEDKLYMLLLTQVDRDMSPIKIWKIGSKEKDWLPTPKHYAMLQQQIMNLKNDPDGDLIYHAYLELDIKNLAQNKENLLPYFEFCQKRVTTALLASESMFGSENPYAKESANIKMVMHRYMSQRAKMNKVSERQIFRPTAIKRNYLIRTKVESDNGINEDKFHIPEITRYYVPKIFWRPSNLVSNVAEREFMLKLADKGKLDWGALHDNLGYDTDEVTSKLYSEQGTALDPVYADARKELIKDPVTRNRILRGKKMKDLDLPTGVPVSGKGAKDAKGKTGTEALASDLLGGAGAGALPAAPKLGRPAKAPEDKSRQPAVVPEEAMSAREKLNEKDELPAPKGEEGPIV